MKKFSLFTTLLIAAFVLTACGSSTNASSTTGSASASDVMTPALQLAVGTLKLEGTDQAIDSQTAAKLLPLWQLLNGLSASSATAQEEVSTVVDQIKATMTTEQVKAIEDMQLTQKDVAMQGGGSGNSAVFTTTSSGANQQITDPGLMGGGAPPDGGIPGGAQGGGQTSGSQSNTSAQSSQVSSSTSLIQQVINLLESKVNS